jgi:ferredoxin
MIRAAQAAGAQWRLLYGGRTRASMAFADDLADYGERVTLRPQDEFGLLDLAGLLERLPPDTPLYACGPEPLLTALEQQCAARIPGLLHLERFKADESQLHHDDDRPIEVVLRRSGKTLTVPADKSILEALEEAGVLVAWSCREGICGTCETAVLDGTPDHRDEVLSEDERESGEIMMICVSRALSESLTLDA